MRAKEIRERSDQELADLESRLTRDLFQLRFRNFTNRLDDTSQLGKLRRDLARVKTVRRQRALGAPAAGKKEP
ncbi:MAG: 50S ribosomal protein L29 [Myxococcales bacterium]|nr:50S ribosomal protein L29 [Myxococcales bacterium]